MPNLTPPSPGDLPTSRALLRSTVIAAVSALVLLVTVVLPAEYGVDPTRVGSVLGLTRMGEIKMALAREAAAADSAEAAALAAGTPAPTTTGEATPPAGDSSAAAEGAPGEATDVTEFTLAPGEGKEIKLVMREGARVNYSWTVAGGVVNYDTHGDPNDAPAGFYHGYGRGTSVPGDEGELVAAFNGTHGWFWRNRGTETVTVTVRTQGDYQELRRLY